MESSLIAQFSSKIKPVLYFSWICGVFPVSNLKSRDASQWRTKIWSLISIYSISLTFLLIFLSTDCTLGSIIEVLQHSDDGATDALSYSSFLIFLTFSKSILSPLLLLKTKYVVSLIRSIVNYDIKHHLKNNTTIWSIKIILLFVTGIVGGIGSFDLTKETLKRISLDESTKCLVLSSIFHSQISVVSHIVHPFLEISVNTYLVIIIVICTSGIEQRIRSITDEFNEKIAKRVGSGSHTKEKQLQIKQSHEYGFYKGSEKIQLGVKSSNFYSGDLEDYGVYLDENDLMNSFLQRFIGVIDMKATLLDSFSMLLFILVSTSILVIILFVYLVLISIKDSATELSLINLIMSLFPLISMGSVTIVRISIICEVGNDLENSVASLGEVMKSVDITDLPTPLANKIQYFQSIVRKVNISLDGAGYFTLNRKFLSNMIGPVITFVVVLAQFRLTDTSSATSKSQETVKNT